MKLLSQINDPADLRKLPASKLQTVADEIREYMIETLSKIGGHIGPSLRRLAECCPRFRRDDVVERESSEGYARSGIYPRCALGGAWSEVHGTDQRARHKLDSPDS